jgi:hypothetical protein
MFASGLGERAMDASGGGARDGTRAAPVHKNKIKKKNKTLFDGKPKGRRLEWRGELRLVRAAEVQISS